MTPHLRLEGDKIPLDRETLEALAVIPGLAEPMRDYFALQAADAVSEKLVAIAARLWGLVMPEGQWVQGVHEVAQGVRAGAADWDDLGVCKDSMLRSLDDFAEELGDWAEMLEEYGHTDHCDWLLGEQLLLRKILKGAE